MARTERTGRTAGGGDGTARPFDPAIIDELRAICGPERVLTEEWDRLSYSYDASFASVLRPGVPDVVVQPESTAEVAAAVKVAARHRVPIVPRAGASAMTGGSVPRAGGITLDLRRMNRVLEIDLDNLQVVCEPGIVHDQLNQQLAPHGFSFPVDPGSTKMATVGGMVSNNSCGMRAVRYGSTYHYVLGLEVVLPSGEVIWTGSMGSKALQSASGLNLNGVFVGAEGTLGVITKLRLKILPKARSRGVVTALFDRLEDAGEATRLIFRGGIIPSALELMDAAAIRAVNAYKPELRLPEVAALLLIEVEGLPAGVAETARTVSDLVQTLTERVEWSDKPAEVAALWQARSVLGAASGLIREHATRVATGEDIAVPISRMPETLAAIGEIGRRHGIACTTYGHIGSGNVHSAFVIDPRNQDEVDRVLQASDEIHQLALRMGGTVTGEHGVGFVRSGYMGQEHGPALAAMQAIKRALDPLGIMNPGKLLPSEE
ncbi:MAG TPA: FAD-binding oxidoreductase [Thermomicrobiales bacterium]|nr:FAD-binding oxidoreductase [Thermomicrobiales bacterium]